MERLKTFISECLKNISGVLTAKYAKEAEAEDQIAFGRLLDHLCLKNAHRVLIFSIISLIGGILVLLTGNGSVWCMTGSFILILSSPAFTWMMLRTSFSHNPPLNLIKLLCYGYWILFSIGCIFVALSDLFSEKTPYSFLIFIAAAVAVPVVDIQESIFFACTIFFPSFIYGFIRNCNVTYFIAVFSVTAAYIWIAALVRCSYSCMWLDSKRIEMTEERCTQISRKDTLTGLLNKAGLSAKFEELTESGTSDRTLSVILIDIDNFRAYNHMYGYDQSDNCLYRVCNCIKIVAKPYTDLVSRFGGDDFVLILENMDDIEVVKLAEQLRQSVETMAQTFGNGIVTVSVGVSGSSKLKGKETYSDLLNEADDQLFIAKSGGRNCVGYKGRAFLSDNRRKPASF